MKLQKEIPQRNGTQKHPERAALFGKQKWIVDARSHQTHDRARRDRAEGQVRSQVRGTVVGGNAQGECILQARAGEKRIESFGRLRRARVDLRASSIQNQQVRGVVRFADPSVQTRAAAEVRTMPVRVRARAS